MEDKYYPRVYDSQPFIDRNGNVIALSDYRRGQYYVVKESGEYRVRTVHYDDMTFEDNEGVTRLARRVSKSYLEGVFTFFLVALGFLVLIGVTAALAALSVMAQYDKASQLLTLEVSSTD